MMYRVVIVCIVSAVILAGAPVPGLAATVLTTQDASTIAGGCNIGYCLFWGFCCAKRCYEPGLCETCTGCAWELFPEFDASGYLLFYGIADQWCDYRAPYGECLGYQNPPGQGRCAGGEENQIYCPGKYCEEYHPPG